MIGRICGSDVGMSGREQKKEKSFIPNLILQSDDHSGGKMMQSTSDVGVGCS